VTTGQRNSPRPRNTYQLRIVLQRTKPPIWRRVLVPPSMYLDTLQQLIQVVMGWEDSHPEVFSPQAVDMIVGEMRR